MTISMTTANYNVQKMPCNNLNAMAHIKVIFPPKGMFIFVFDVQFIIFS